MKEEKSLEVYFNFIKHFIADFLIGRLLVLNRKSLTLPPLALTIAAKTSVKALEDNLWLQFFVANNKKLKYNEQPKTETLPFFVETE